tara:strand:+ start:627 stop:2072 length:1446 start_codon:yes stop_codon:yes gene_type:complete
LNNKKIKVKNICCLGAGYVGGPTMVVLAEKCPQINVFVTDIDKKKIERWNSKQFENLPVYEPGLSDLVKKCRNKNLFFTTDIQNAIQNSDIVFISVNTPTKTQGHGAGYASDLKWVESSARIVGQFAKGHTIIVEKSTVPVRTAELIQKIINHYKTDELLTDINNKKTFSVLSSPEFLAEGTAIKDLEFPDRVLIGGDDNDALDTLSLIYQEWIPIKKIFRTNLWSSELSKLTANAFLAQRISSINAISSLCEPSGADIKEVSKAIGADSRIGGKFLQAGPGFGGSCFQKDLLNLIYLCRFYNLDSAADYWEQVIKLNEWQKKRISKIIIEAFFGTLSSKKIVLLGYSFKPNTNDIRESPAISIALQLIENGATVFIHDPKVSESQIRNSIEIEETYQKTKNSINDNWSYEKDLEKIVVDADAIVIVTEWEEYFNLNWRGINKLMRRPSWLFDTRGIVNAKELEETKINFWQVGKGFLKKE